MAGRCRQRCRRRCRPLCQSAFSARGAGKCDKRRGARKKRPKNAAREGPNKTAYIEKEEKARQRRFPAAVGELHRRRARRRRRAQRLQRHGPRIERAAERREGVRGGLLRQTASNRLRIAIATVRETSLCNGSSRRSPTKTRPNRRASSARHHASPRRVLKTFHFRPKTQSTEPSQTSEAQNPESRAIVLSIYPTHTRAKGRRRNRSHVATRPQRSSTF